MGAGGGRGQPCPWEAPQAATASRRDESSFRGLYRRHTPRLFALGLRLTGGDRGDAEELVQQAWVRGIERLDCFGRRSSFSTWLCGILVNCHRELARRRRRAAPLEAVPPPPAAPPPEFSSSRAWDAIDLERAIARLADGYREVLVLHDVTGYSHREIADLLGIEEGTSKSQLARARARLRETLQGGDTQRSTGRGKS